MTIFPLEIKAHLKELKARGIILIGLEDYTQCLGSPETYFYMTEWKGWKTAKEAKAFISKEFGINPISYRNGVKTEIVMS